MTIGFTRAAPTRSRASAMAVAALAALIVLAGCTAGSSGAPAGSSASPSASVVAVPGWPSAMAALGHSGLTGYDSENPGVDARQNSWATGDAPEVDSLYRRIVAQNPAMQGNAVNLAVDGSGVVDLLRQSKELAGMTPSPELVVIQSIDNDMQCDGTDAEHLPVYRAGLVEVMDELSAGLPDAMIFFVSQWSSVQLYDAAAIQRDPSHIAGTGPCDTVDPATQQIVPEKEAYLQALVDEYFATVVDVCSGYENCRTDGGAMQTLAVAPDDLTPDLNHLMASGHAKMAAIAWRVLYPDS